MVSLKINTIKTSFLDVKSFSVSAKQVVFIRGESGSGKSLLLRAIADIDLNEADISLNGQQRDSISAVEWRKQVSLLPARAQWWGDCIEDSLQCSLEDLVSLSLPENILHQEIASISSGENQRLALLRLLQHKPKVLLLDEPTANLDSSSMEKMERFIIGYLKNNNAGAIWVSHDAEQIKRVSLQIESHCLDIEKGQLEAKHD